MKHFDEALHRIRAAIFDVDGTLLNSMGMWNTLTFDYAAKKGVYAPPGLNKKMNELSLEQCAEYYRDVLGVKGTIESIMAEIVALSAAQYRDTIPEVRGAAEFLKTLRSRGIHTAVATASDLTALRPAFERLGLRENIDVLESCTTIGKSKEHPDIFLKCAADFGAKPEECVVFEDALYSVRTAKQAGFPVVGIYDPAQSPEERAELERLCDRCIENYEILLAELLPPEDM